MCRRYKVCAVTAACFLASCLSPVDSAVASVDPSGWLPDDTLCVRWTNGDTLSKVSVGILLRYDRRLLQNSDTLSVWVETTSADSLTVCERYRFLPADLVCSTSSGLQEATLPYRHNVVLNRKGTYRFAFRQGETLPIEGIWAIGVTVQPE